MQNKFKKILIANRGEIALRIIRSAKSMGIKTVALYTNGEEDSKHVLSADESFLLGSGSLNDTYLNIDKIVELAIISEAQAIHPGYGFLSENADFAKACIENNIVFIGPSIDVLSRTGNKVIAKSLAQKVGVNVLESRVLDNEQLSKLDGKIKFPQLIKASFGGGGKGMQVVHSYNELIEKFESAQRSAMNYFGNDEIFLEDYIENARHIEVQVIGDKYGSLVHLFERDCTVQRNHQKIIEEAPAACLSSSLRNKLHEAAISICKEVAYGNAGTVEFLVDENDMFYFLEINPRIQVEHPVTEQITNIDIVAEQLNIAAGNPLSFSQNEVKLVGHAIEARIYAEDPSCEFMPSGKPVGYYSFPYDKNIRIETAIGNNASETVQFDPLLCKLIATGKNRSEAITNLINALEKTVLLGPTTNLLYLKEIVKTNSFKDNILITRFCELNHNDLLERIAEFKTGYNQLFLLAASVYSLYNKLPEKAISVWESVGYWRMYNNVEIEIGDETFNVCFETRNVDIQIKTNKHSFVATVKEHSTNSNGFTVEIEGEEKNFVAIPKNNARKQLAFDGMTVGISRKNHLDYYPENYTVECDTDLEVSNVVKSHLYGKVVAVKIEKNQIVNKGDVLLVIESMKSENVLVSPQKAKVKSVNVLVGEQVTDQMPLVSLEDL